MTYTIKRGDTLGKLARQFGVSVSDITRINNIKNPNRIYAGDTIKLPGYPDMAYLNYDKTSVVAIAESEVGYNEKASNDQLDDPEANKGNANYTKYARDLDAIPFFNGRKNGYEWCAVFVCWCFVQAYGYEATKTLLCLPTKASSNYAAGVDYMANYFRKQNQYHTSKPEPGDIIFFGQDDASFETGVDLTHTGLVVQVTDKTVYTVEGNTLPNQGEVNEGGGVYRKAYSLTYKRIKGFGRPDYSAATFTTDNRYLSEAEMKVNAAYIYNWLYPRGWSIQAIAGMLGNMETESTINPGIWQNLTENPANGYGLVQWTPSTKYTSWCEENSLDPAHMVSALLRIEWELENGEQWIQTDEYPISFAQYKTAEAPAYDMAMAFLANYERPADPSQPARGEQAQKWYDYLVKLPKTGGVFKKVPGVSLILKYMVTKGR